MTCWRPTHALGSSRRAAPRIEDVGAAPATGCMILGFVRTGLGVRLGVGDPPKEGLP